MVLAFEMSLNFRRATAVGRLWHDVSSVRL